MLKLSTSLALAVAVTIAAPSFSNGVAGAKAGTKVCKSKYLRRAK
jgi:hypothetical protein